MTNDNHESERNEILGDLHNLMLGMSVGGKTAKNSTDYAIVERAYNFIKGGEV